MKPLRLPRTTLGRKSNGIQRREEAGPYPTRSVVSQDLRIPIADSPADSVVLECCGSLVVHQLKSAAESPAAVRDHFAADRIQHLSLPDCL